MDRAKLEFLKLNRGTMKVINSCDYVGLHAPVCTVYSPGTAFDFSGMKLTAIGTSVTAQATAVEATDDASVCTLDRCVGHGSGATVQHAPLPIDDGDTCTIDSCDPVSGVTHVNNTSDPACVYLPPPSPVDPSIPTSTAADATGLFTSQGGTAGALVAERATIVRGRVFETPAGGQSAVAPGVHVTVLGHPELGGTDTLADGSYALAINGGGLTILDFAKANRIGAQRDVRSRWHEVVVASDVELMQHDNAGTVVTAGAATMQVVVGRTIPVAEDSHGPRAAVLFVPPGTTSPNVAGSNWTVHLTEFTVGENGFRRMPADLPAASAYTYAFEASIDQATGPKVVFNQPLPFYVDNFLSFPVGETVPIGSYDRQKGQWVPEETGRIIKIVSITGGLADLDVDKVAGIDTGAALTALGITNAERAQLAIQYPSPGKSLWRGRLAHFTPFDLNWGISAPVDASQPDVSPPTCDGSKPKSCKTTGASTIECHNQVISEDIAIVGTPYALRYQNDRAKGWKSTIQVNLTGPTPFPTGKAPARIDWEVYLAGRKFAGAALPTTTNQKVDVFWDGLDSFGRPYQGTLLANVRVGNTYNPVYSGTSSFGSPPNGGSISLTALRQVTLWRDFQVEVGGVYAQGLGLGGLSLNVQSTLLPESGAVYHGDGRTQVAPLGYRVDLLGGTGGGPAVDGVPATTANLAALDMSVAPDGLVYMSGGASVWSIDMAGILSQVAGAPPTIALTDGVAALHAAVFPVAIQATERGDILFADRNGNRIWRITNETPRRVRLVAGTGAATCTGACGDGGPATAAVIPNPLDVFENQDGSIYIASGPRVRRVDPAGQISTFYTFAANPRELAVSRDGGMWVYVDDNYVYRLSPTGTQIGARTSDAALCAGNYANFFLDVDENLASTCQGWIGWGPGRFRIGGSPGSNGYAGNGGPALQARFDQLGRVRARPNGDLVVHDQGALNTAIRLLSKRGRFLTQSGSIAVADEDGDVVREFSDTGRHLRTRSALTGALRETLGYDAGGRLISITDGDGQVTTIQRDGAGVPLSITAPHGQVTSLLADANGYLSRITNPNTEAWTLEMSATGLLNRSIDPRGGLHQYQYTVDGRLARAEAPGGFAYTLGKTAIPGGRKVSITSPEARVRTYGFSVDGAGTETRTGTTPDGIVTTETQTAGDVSTLTRPNGMVSITTLKPDPRFGSRAPLVTEEEVTPSGKRHWTEVTRTATLANPADPYSITAETTVVAENDRACSTGASCTRSTSTATYTRSNNTIVTTSAGGRQGTTVLDAKDRVVQRSVPGVAPISVFYGPSGRVDHVTQSGRTVGFAYDAQGMLWQVTDPAGRSAVYTRNAAGRVTSVLLPGSRTVLSTIDAAGNLASLTPPGQTAHEQAFDGRNLMTNYAPPSVPAVDGHSGYEYDGDRFLKKVLRSDGGLTFNYSPTSALLSGVASVDASKTYLRFADGRVSSVTTGDGVGLGFTYDGDYLLTAGWTGPFTKTVTHTYDNHHARSTTDIAGSVASWSYDADDLLIGATGVGAALSIARDAQNGRITGTTVDQVVQTLGVDSTYGELGTIAYAKGATPLYSVTYTRDPLLGRVTSKSETDSAGTVVTNYEYDAAGRLRRENNGTSDTTWAYDDNGNRTTVNGAVSASFDAQDRVISAAGATYSHDDNGNILTKVVGAATTTYTWDRLGNLRTVQMPTGSPITYVYDGLGRRIGRKVGGVFKRGWLYDGQLRIIAEIDETSAVQKRFLYGSRKNVPDTMVTAAGTFRFVTDQVGSVRLIVNANTGATLQRITYDAWGNVQADSNPGWQPFGFAGGLYDPDTKLVHFGAREYDPELGRWLSKDEARWGGGLNFYAYAANDPANLIDPTGRTPQGAAVGMTIGGIIGGAFGFGVGTGLGGSGLVLGPAVVITVPAGAVLGGTIGFAGGAALGGYLGNGISDALAAASSKDEPVAAPVPEVSTKAYPQCSGKNNDDAIKCCKEATGYEMGDEKCPKVHPTRGTFFDDSSKRNYQKCLGENGVPYFPW